MTFSGGPPKKQPTQPIATSLTSTALVKLLADHEALTVDHRSVRNPDGSIGDSVDRDALEQMDVADTNDHVRAGHHAKVTALDNDLV